MGYFELSKENVDRLHELADLQHPHLKGDNDTRLLIDKAYNREPLTNREAFDCGKYYQRMLDQLDQFGDNRELYGEYVEAILHFKYAI